MSNIIEHADAPENWPISRLVFEINTRHAEAEESASQAVRSALQLGRLLHIAKGHVEHGGWEAWLQENTHLAVRTCRAYMQLANRYPKLPEPERQRVADLPLRDAIRSISTEATAPPRSRTPSIEIPARSDRERADQQFKKSAGEIKKLAKWISFGTVPSKEIDRARKVLHAALDALDALAAEHREPPADESQCTADDYLKAKGC